MQHTTTPKRPNRQRKVAPAMEQRLLDELNDRIWLYVEADDVSDDLGSVNDFHVIDGPRGGFAFQYLIGDLLVTQVLARDHSPWEPGRTLLTCGKLRPVERAQVDRTTWRYATPSDFKEFGYAAPTSKDLSAEDAAGFLGVVHNFITANPGDQLPVCEWREMTFSAIRSGVLIDMPPKDAAPRVHVYLCCDGWKPFSYKTRTWSAPPADAHPSGFYWATQP